MEETIRVIEKTVFQNGGVIISSFPLSVLEILTQDGLRLVALILLSNLLLAIIFLLFSLSFFSFKRFEIFIYSSPTK